MNEREENGERTRQIDGSKKGKKEGVKETVWYTNRNTNTRSTRELKTVNKKGKNEVKGDKKEICRNTGDTKKVKKREKNHEN